MRDFILLTGWIGSLVLGAGVCQAEDVIKSMSSSKITPLPLKSARPKASAKTKTQSIGSKASGPDCPEQWRSLKNCRLTSGEQVYQFREDKVLYNNGRGRWVFDFPEGALAKEWYRIKLTKLHDQDLIEWYGWMPEVGDGDVGALHWLVLTVKPEGLNVLLNEVVRHRHKGKEDMMTVHALRRQGDIVIWEVGYRHGELEVERQPASQ